MSENKKTFTAMNNDLRATLFTNISDLLGELEGVQTDSATLTFPTVREDGIEMYASLKLTLHNPEKFDFEFALSEWEAKVKANAEKAAAKAKKDAEAREKKEAKAREKAAKESKGEDEGAGE